MSHISTQQPKRLIHKLEIYRSDVVVLRKGEGGGGGGKRSGITELTRDALARLAFTAANTSVEFEEMITLTYPREYPSNGREVKRHLRAMLQAIRRKARKLDNRLSYLWFLEFQRRGAPHVHIFYAGARLANEDSRAWVSERWYEIVDSGDEKHLAAGTRTEAIRHKDGARRYAVKYASKPEQKIVPPDYHNVGRFWGCSRDVTPEPIGSLTTSGATDEEAAELLQGWRYLDNVRDDLPSVLYNAAPVVMQNWGIAAEGVQI